MVGRSVNVKIVASIADQNIRRKNAAHGTPGRRAVASSMASGDVTAPFKVPHTSSTVSFRSPHTQPKNTTTNRTRPDQ